MIAKLLPYHNAPSSSGSLPTTNISNNKENFHSGDIVIIHSSKNKIKKKVRKAVYVWDVLPYTNLTFRWPCIMIYSYDKTSQMH